MDCHLRRAPNGRKEAELRRLGICFMLVSTCAASKTKSSAEEEDIDENIRWFRKDERQVSMEAESIHVEDDTLLGRL